MTSDVLVKENEADSGYDGSRNGKTRDRFSACKHSDIKHSADTDDKEWPDEAPEIEASEYLSEKRKNTDGNKNTTTDKSPYIALCRHGLLLDMGCCWVNLAAIQAYKYYTSKARIG